MRQSLYYFTKNSKDFYGIVFLYDPTIHQIIPGNRPDCHPTVRMSPFIAHRRISDHHRRPLREIAYWHLCLVYSTFEYAYLGQSSYRRFVGLVYSHPNGSIRNAALRKRKELWLSLDYGLRASFFLLVKGY